MDNAVEAIKPYGNTGESKAQEVRDMFNSIAPAYDFMNHAMTLGIDKWWRRIAVKRLKSRPHNALLDVATGTGDFALQLCRSLKLQSVTGIDLSEGMLAVASEKARKQGYGNIIKLQQADCLQLPFGDATFDAVTVAFGIRNFEHIDRCLAQMQRVLKPGGMLCALELSTPTNAFIRFFYDLYTLHVIPAIGGLKSGDPEAYRYLPRSIAAVPQGEAMLALMRQAGFASCKATRLTLGICTLYTAIKP